MSKKKSKKVHEFYEYIEKIDLTDSDYEAKIKTRAKKLFDDLHRFGRENVFNHVQAASSLIFRENDVLGTDEGMGIKKTMALEYFFILAIDKYGMGSVLEKLLPQRIIYEKYSKFNPINWLLWIFNKIVWSKVTVHPSFQEDKAFSEAVKKIKEIYEPTVYLDRNDKDLRKAVKIIIERIVNVAFKEEAKIECLIDLSPLSTTEALTEKLAINLIDFNPSESSGDLKGLIFPESWENELPPPHPSLFDPPPLPPPPPENNENGQRIKLFNAINGTGGSANFKFKKHVDPTSQNKDKKPTENKGCDVASILARRPMMEFSDTESDDSDSEPEQDWRGFERNSIFSNASSNINMVADSTSSAAPSHCI